ncbi:MAG: MBL fold metallo-hydrolase [Sulfuricella sp.]|nr:MBL fold metallo-hydrolase [Sulfuricella sp.]
MKKLLLIIAALGISLTAQAAAIPEPQVVRITPRIYALLGPVGLPSPHNQGYMVNTTVIVGERGVILIDSGSSDEVGSHLAKAIAKITPKPVTHIINTHHHGDHHLGNSAFKNARVLSSEECRKLVEKTGAEWVALMENLVGHKLPNTRPVPADVTVPGDSRTESSLQDVKLLLWAPKGSHTPGDLMVWLPDDKVLIGGDILVNGLVPNLRDANLKNWITALRQVEELAPATVVPGHGPLMNKADVAKLHKMLVGFYAGVEGGYKKGLNDSEIRPTLDLSEWQKLKEYDAAMGANINRAYLEIEAENF